MGREGGREGLGLGVDWKMRVVGTGEIRQGGAEGVKTKMSKDCLRRTRELGSRRKALYVV